MKTFGRTTIYVPFTEEEILALSEEKREEAIISIIEMSVGIHEKNKTETLYLKDYLKGDQDIYREKQKLTRPEINNMTVENWAWAMVDFEKGYLLGKPIQYVQLNDSGEHEVAVLNKYVRYEQKKAKDLFSFEDVLACGRSFVYKNYQKPNDDDEAPFEILNCNAEDTEVVYSSKIGNKQIGSYIQTSMQYIATVINPETKEIETKAIPYKEYTFYLRNKCYVLNDKSGKIQVESKKTRPIVLNEHVITEYYINRQRLSLIEIGKDLFNDINYLESMDKDDMESFVNAIMVFTNVEVTEAEIEAIKELGAVCINSTENKKASIDLLQQRLNATDTQTYYTRLLTSLHQILGVPMASDNGSVTSGDTGRAKLTGQGYLMSSIRAENAETMFGMCDMEMLKGVLKACKLAPNAEIKNLRISDIEPKFQRDMSDNILTKSQALLNLYSADIPRAFANSIIGLFGDPNAVTKEQERLFGAQVSQLNSKKVDETIDVTDDNTNDPMKSQKVDDKQIEVQDKANNQKNNMNKVEASDNQGQ